MHVVLFGNDIKTLFDAIATNNVPLIEFGDQLSKCISLFYIAHLVCLYLDGVEGNEQQDF